MSEDPEPFVADTAKIISLVDKASWQAKLVRSDKGMPKPILANAITALRLAPEWQKNIGFNEFSQQLAITGPLPFAAAMGAEWRDRHDALVTDWLQHAHIIVSREVASIAVRVVAEENPFHPVRDYLERISWDGEPRLDVLAVRYLGCEDSLYVRAVVPRWAISAVARIYKPGCKADCCIILEGKQAIGKSTALRRLGEPWFTDELADLGSKDSEMQIAGAWIIELAELDSMTRGEVSRIKAFMSRDTDRFRPPFGRNLVSVPRQCVFAGSVNHNDYLRDETGGRRFWPLACERIDCDSLGADRDQLWAEARDRYLAGENWWIDDASIEGAAIAEQAQRYQSDPWTAVIQEHLYNSLIYESGVSIEDILKNAIERPKKDWTQADKNRVGRILRSMSWSRFKARDGDRREWRYRREPD